MVHSLAAAALMCVGADAFGLFHRPTEMTEKEVTAFLREHNQKLGIIPTKTDKRFRYQIQKNGGVADQMQKAMYEQLTVHSEFYDDKCENPMISPINKHNKDGKWRFMMFFHGMGGAPCQIRLLKDTVYKVFKNNRVKMYTASGDHMSNVTKPFLQRYTKEGTDGRAKLLADSVMKMVHEAQTNHSQPEKVGVYVSSNGMLDFLNSWKHLHDKGIEDKIFIYWVAAMDDHVNLDGGGAVAKVLERKKEQLLPCSKDRVMDMSECYFPVGGVYEKLNPEMALHFKGKRWEYNPETEEYDNNDFMYRKEDIEHRLYWKGRYYTEVYDSPWYNTVMGRQTEFMQNNPDIKINVPVCTLLATNDGYWKASVPALNKMMDKYFTGPRHVLAKKTSHLWIINSNIVHEFVEFCENDGKVEAPDTEIYGKQVGWKTGGLGAHSDYVVPTEKIQKKSE